MRKKIVIKSDELKLVYGEVYSPLCIDTDSEAMTVDEIRKMAHQFLISGKVNKIDVNHNYEESGCSVVESFIASKNDPNGFIEGSWVLGVRIADRLWPLVKKGELNGFSFSGAASREDIQVIAKSTKKLVGTTEKALDLEDAHSHSIEINFNKDGAIIPCETGENKGHTHAIKHTTATDSYNGHSHRLVLINNTPES